MEVTYANCEVDFEELSRSLGGVCNEMRVLGSVELLQEYERCRQEYLDEYLRIIDVMYDLDKARKNCIRSWVYSTGRMWDLGWDTRLQKFSAAKARYLMVRKMFLNEMKIDLYLPPNIERWLRTRDMPEFLRMYHPDESG